MRVPVYAPNGAVATSQPLAAQAGLAVLREGGNAVDAAIATAVTLTVVQPGSNDIGADLFALVWDGAALHGLNGSGRTPGGLHLAAMQAAAEPPSPALGGAPGLTELAPPARGWLPVTVPGAPAGWRDLHQRFGSLPFERLFADAVRYAEHGWTVSPGVAAGWARAAQVYAQLDDLPECRAWASVFGQVPRAGELVRNATAGRALRLISGSCGNDFYRGEIAAALVRLAADTGGLLSADDLAGHTSTWVEPISASYQGYTVYELPPNGQGVATLQALALLAGSPQPSPHEPPSPHQQIEAMKLGFADAHRYVADGASVDWMLDPAYLARRRALIGARASDPAPGDPMRGGTVYLATADSAGMMVSLIQSTYMGFGSYVVLPEYGFGLQNRGAGLSLDPAHPNVAGPGKRPFHTIIPGFLSRAGEPVGPFGVMGGHMQPQGHLQLVLYTVAGLDPQAALDQPRWYWHRGREVLVEPGIDPADLVAQGHEVRVASAGERSTFGLGQAIWRLPGGGYVAGSDQRGDGYPAAY